MPNDQDVCLVIRVFDNQKNFLGGTVDIDYQPQDGAGDTQKTQGADASKPIQVSGLQRFPQVAVYLVTVTPTDVFIPTSQFLTIPASGFNTVDFVIDKGTKVPQDGLLIVKLDDPNGKPLTGSVDITLVNLATGATSENTIDYSQPVPFANLQQQGRYQVTVKPASMPNSQTQTITLPPKGSATIAFTFAPSASQQFVVKGYLVFDNGLAAAGITVRVFNVNFGGQDVKLDEATSDAQGKYSITYTPPGPALPNLQVRVLDSTGKEVTISATKYNASQSETLNLVVPAITHPLAPEFQRLASDMGRSIGAVANLGQAQEGKDRQDLTLLNQSTNWDARVVALAATAAQHTATIGLDHDVSVRAVSSGTAQRSIAARERAGSNGKTSPCQSQPVRNRKLQRSANLRRNHRLSEFCEHDAVGDRRAWSGLEIQRNVVALPGRSQPAKRICRPLLQSTSGKRRFLDAGRQSEDSACDPGQPQTPGQIPLSHLQQCAVGRETSR